MLALAVVLLIAAVAAAVAWKYHNRDPCDGVVCGAGSVCWHGECAVPCGAGYCPAGQICQNRICTDPCQGVVCMIGQTCQNGLCVDPCQGVSCPAGQVCQGGTCVDSCQGVTCPAGQTCVSGTCVSGCPGGIDMTAQPGSTVQIVNSTSEQPLHVFLEYANFNQSGGKPSLAPPPTPWRIIQGSAGVTIKPPANYYPSSNPPPGAAPPYFAPNDAGSATWQELIMPSQTAVVLSIPDFTKGQPFSIRPVKYNNGSPCSGGVGDCGMPVLIESGKDMVGDMSAVDGVNFRLCYQFTTSAGSSVMNFKTNPCAAIGANPKGCRNPSVDGIFKASLVGTAGCQPGSPHCWQSDPCPAGTCNLDGASRAWCDAINDGQCANSSSTWSKAQESGGPDSCTGHNLFTTYCYSHNDAASSPTFAAPYKMKLVYRDLAGN